MCGIFCEIAAVTPTGDTPTALDSVPKLRFLLERRGPDAQAELERDFEDEEGKKWRAHFYASVLWLQGSSIVRQPVTNSLGDVLLWNGDVFASDDTDVINVEAGQSDTEAVFEAMVAAAQSTAHKSSACLESAVCRVVSAIRGPFAFVFYSAKANTLFVGRDRLGRHSLLVSLKSDGLVISSVGAEALEPCRELPASGFYAVDLNSAFKGKFVSLVPYRTPLKTIEDDPFSAVLNVGDLPVQTRGLDSSDECVNNAEELSENETATKLFDPSAIDVNDPFKILEAYLSFDEANNNNVKRLLDALTESVRTRVETMPKLCKTCVRKAVNSNEAAERNQVANEDCKISEPLRTMNILDSGDQSSIVSDTNETTPASCQHCKLAVLFSGGLDSSVLALLCDRVLPPSESVDLLNVAFEMADGSYSVPDRNTAESTFQELRELCPKRVFNLVKVDVARASLSFWRREHVSHLLHPLRSVLDDSIGCALWFAANAQSSARVMLHGPGADEQLGGYSRHRVRFAQGGKEALSAELSMEMARIAERNLGRDNRMVADHGVAPRFPFLDEQVVSLLSSTDVCAKADFRLPRGTGEKILLRALAFGLGLRRAAVEPKRAIQFGSRIAKMENRREKADDEAVRD